ncbi:rare lipoprotein A [Prosthecobacter fusiformis]|uniref:Probable endolytic peptidoglycan transglycosylase RlpA n=1 Tax=Prosthecobacter fusiformis TaxID=48464 RepID=A0A4V3FIC0_9BACT|nr:septal ring lytic transglycosylase RlpA family protein [Prosthecobacter fusiformis]TDU81813.1 rare lipoprotein A [Prosthecobacter fusiformis]
MFCRWFFYLAMLALVSCASRPPPYQEQGWASYVADHYTGRPTSSGEIYYPQAYTAAHTSLPFGTVVTVKNIMNGQKVNVTINDRFPYYPGRVINLSSIAAQKIGIPYMQMGQVELTAENVGQGSYGQRGYAQQPAYPQQQATYPSQPAYGGYNPQPAATYPTYPSSPAATGGGYQVQQPAGSTPYAPGYNGGGGTPPGLQTY